MRAAFVIAVIVIGMAGEARALDPFEIQVYDGTANARRAYGLELHLNDVASGRTTATPPELPANHQAHVTLEPSYGVTPSWELGAYLQGAFRPSGQFDFAGVKLRSKLVTPPGWRPHLRAGLNIEVSYLPTTYEADQWGAELRPIVAWENERVLLAANPIIDLPLRRGRVTFEPAATAVLKLAGRVGLGVEYYGDLGPIAAPDRLADEQHYLFEVLNLLGVRDFELNVGVGEGLTAASNAFVVKMILGRTWGR
jgi:hypothetical protein